MNKKIMLQSSLTLTLFILINWGFWEVLVIQGMEEPWASFTVYAVLIVIVICIWRKSLFKEWIRIKDETKNLKITDYLDSNGMLKVVATLRDKFFAHLDKICVNSDCRIDLSVAMRDIDSNEINR